MADGSSFHQIQLGKNLAHSQGHPKSSLLLHNYFNDLKAWDGVYFFTDQISSGRVFLAAHVNASTVTVNSFRVSGSELSLIGSHELNLCAPAFPVRVERHKIAFEAVENGKLCSERHVIELVESENGGPSLISRTGN